MEDFPVQPVGGRADAGLIQQQDRVLSRCLLQSPLYCTGVAAAVEVTSVSRRQGPLKRSLGLFHTPKAFSCQVTLELQMLLHPVEVTGASMRKDPCMQPEALGGPLVHAQSS